MTGRPSIRARRAARLAGALAALLLPPLLALAPPLAAEEAPAALMAAPSPVSCAGAHCSPDAAAPPATHAVSDAAGLARALEAARGGEVVALAPGDYGTLRLQGRRFEAPVALRSADPADPAVLRGMDLRRVENLRLEGLLFDGVQPPGAGPRDSRPFRIAGGGNIEIARSTFEGDVASGTGRSADDGFAAGHGLMARGTQGLAVRGSLFTTWFRGAAFDGVDDLVVEGNRITAMRSEGLNLVAVRDARIEGNEIGDFRVSPDSPDHRDMIQFWTTRSTRPSERVLIRGNLLHAGQGQATQSIFMRNEEVDKGRAGREMFYRDIAIEENVILNAHTHGIAVGEAEGLTIRRNTLLRLPSAAEPGGSRGLTTPAIRVSPRSSGVVIESNVTGGIKGPEDPAAHPGWRVADNLVVQGFEPGAPGWVGDLLLAPPFDPRYRPEGPLGDGRRGAPMLVLGAAESGGGTHEASLEPVIRVSVDPSAPNRFAFDAGLSLGLDAAGGAVFEWRFADGSRAEGARVTRALPEGTQAVRLAVAAPDGRRAEARAEVVVPSPLVLRLDAETGALVGPRGAVAALPGGPGPLRLGSGLEVPAARLGRLPGSETAEIALRFRAEPGARGEILALGEGLRLSLDALGGLRVALRPDGGRPAELRTGPLGLGDGAWHEAVVRIEAGQGRTPGRLALLVDGRLRVEGRAPGPLPARGALRLGHPEAEQGLRGEIDRLELRVGGWEAPT